MPSVGCVREALVGTLTECQLTDLVCREVDHLDVVPRSGARGVRNLVESGRRPRGPIGVVRRQALETQPVGSLQKAVALVG